MPRLIVYRTKNVNASVPLPISVTDKPNLMMLFPNDYRKAVTFSSEYMQELMVNLETMRAAGTIGYQVDTHDIDPENIKILEGLELTDGTSANTAANYYNNVSVGVARVGNQTYRYGGAIDLDPLALGITVAGVSTATDLLVTLYAIKARFYLVRLYTVATGLESLMIIPVYGTSALTATVGAVGVDDYYPTDAEVEAAFKALQLANHATFIYIDWLEIGRCLLSRAGAVITSSYVDLKTRDKNTNMNFRTLEVNIEYGVDVLPAATSMTKAVVLPEGAVFFGAMCRQDEVFTTLNTPTLKFGIVGDDDAFFDTFNLTGVGVQTTLVAAGGFLGGALMVGKQAVLTFGAINNLSLATAGKLSVVLFYGEMPASTDAFGPHPQYRDENVL